MQHSATDGVTCSICLCVCVSVHWSHHDPCRKMVELIKLLLGWRAHWTTCHIRAGLEPHQNHITQFFKWARCSSCFQTNSVNPLNSLHLQIKLLHCIICLNKFDGLCTKFNQTLDMICFYFLSILSSEYFSQFLHYFSCVIQNEILFN